MANIHVEPVTILGLSWEEYEALRTAVSVLKELYEFGNDELMLTSSETGECIFFDELRRTMGVLDALHDNRCWQIKEK